MICRAVQRVEVDMSLMMMLIDLLLLSLSRSISVLSTYSAVLTRHVSSSPFFSMIKRLEARRDIL